MSKVHKKDKDTQIAAETAKITIAYHWERSKNF